MPWNVGEEGYRRFADEDINRVIVQEVKDLQQLCYEVTNETQGDEHSFQLMHHEIFELIEEAGKPVAYVKLNNSLAVLITTMFKLKEFLMLGKSMKLHSGQPADI